MKPQHIIAAALGMMLCPYAAAGQEEAPPVAFATYYYCDQSREEAADVIFEEVLGPIFDEHVSAGHLSAWGWMGHQAGGKWRRLGYIVAADTDVLLDTRDQIIDELLTEHGDAAQELTAVCPSHDDYIWSSVAGSQPVGELAEDRPDADLSTYYVCDVTRQARADTLVTEVFAPIFDRHVGEGEFTSWLWLSHIVGGKYRRLLGFDGADHKTILNTLGTVIGEMQEEHPDEAREFGEICNSHQDYMWNILISKP